MIDFESDIASGEQLFPEEELDEEVNFEVSQKYLLNAMPLRKAQQIASPQLQLENPRQSSDGLQGPNGNQVESDSTEQPQDSLLPLPRDQDAPVQLSASEQSEDSVRKLLSAELDSESRILSSLFIACAGGLFCALLTAVIFPQIAAFIFVPLLSAIGLPIGSVVTFCVAFLAFGGTIGLGIGIYRLVENLSSKNSNDIPAKSSPPLENDSGGQGVERNCSENQITDVPRIVRETPLEYGNTDGENQTKEDSLKNFQGVPIQSAPADDKPEDNGARLNVALENLVRFFDELKTNYEEKKGNFSKNLPKLMEEVTALGGEFGLGIFHEFVSFAAPNTLNPPAIDGLSLQIKRLSQFQKLTPRSSYILLLEQLHRCGIITVTANVSQLMGKDTKTVDDGSSTMLSSLWQLREIFNGGAKADGNRRKNISQCLANIMRISNTVFINAEKKERIGGLLDKIDPIINEENCGFYPSDASSAWKDVVDAIDRIIKSCLNKELDVCQCSEIEKNILKILSRWRVDFHASQAKEMLKDLKSDLINWDYDQKVYLEKISEHLGKLKQDISNSAREMCIDLGEELDEGDEDSANKPFNERIYRLAVEMEKFVANSVDLRKLQALNGKVAKAMKILQSKQQS
ncbi:MAG: hypothetical protein LBI69_04840 [Puniceicoccales bacterium]|jgi:hypothetical protein|nr:hypothetical protein [Puniceicoccales bacterium]